ncbi:MAG: hypothetical protein JW742_09275 [Candidatus Aminicenantes bacterium]|nr:hypothetical protein [Candidatus Aminicenantes bacterium]
MRHLRPLLSAFAAWVVVCGGLAVWRPPAAAAGDRMNTREALKQRDIARADRYRTLAGKTVMAPPAGRPTAAGLPADKDDDGMPDTWEKAKGFNPADPNDAWLDGDNDQVVNLFECQLGSDPKSAASPPVVTVGSTGAEDYPDLEQALDGAAPGSCIRVAAGTHRLNYMTFDVKVIMVQGGWKPNFTVRNLKTYPTVLDGSNEDDDEVLRFSFTSGNPVVILDGLKIINGNGYMGAVTLLAQTRAFLRTSIFNCLIVKSSSDADYGGALHMNNWDASLSDRTIANTVIAGNTASGIYAQITDSSKARWRILHSAIAKNTNGGGNNGFGIEAFELESAALRTHIFNSILWGNAQADLNIRWDGLLFSVDHSDVGKVLAEYGAKYVKGSGLLNKNPKFVAPGSANYHLKTVSPVINKGIAKGIPLTDFEGDKRVKGAAPDMGPDEVK